MRRVLHVIGIRNGWAIDGRGKALSAALAEQYDCTVVSTDEPLPAGDGFDLIHLHSLVFIPRVAAAGYLEHRCWGFELPSERALRRLARAGAAVKEASFCVAKSPRLKEIIAPELGPDARCEFIANGVDCEMFRPRKLRVGWVGRKEESYKRFKGYGLVSEAVSALGERWRGAAQIEFAPDASCYPVRVLGRQAMAAYYKSLDALVCASQSEGCSNVVMEALAAGVPVVSTDVGCAGVLREEVGLTIVERTADAIAEGLESVLGDSARRVQVMRDRYSWRAIAEQYARLYREVLEWKCHDG